jgi:hypothetical protein
MWTSLLSKSMFSPISILVCSSLTDFAFADLLIYRTLVSLLQYATAWTEKDYSPENAFSLEAVWVREKVYTFDHYWRNVSRMVGTDPLYSHPELLAWCPAVQVYLAWLAGTLPLCSVMAKNSEKIGTLYCEYGLTLQPPWGLVVCPGS